MYEKIIAPKLQLVKKQAVSPPAFTAVLNEGGLARPAATVEGVGDFNFLLFKRSLKKKYKI